VIPRAVEASGGVERDSRHGKLRHMRRLLEIAARLDIEWNTLGGLAGSDLMADEDVHVERPRYRCALDQV
jgi:hypothetical protein